VIAASDDNSVDQRQQIALAEGSTHTWSMQNTWRWQRGALATDNERFWAE